MNHFYQVYSSMVISTYAHKRRDKEDGARQETVTKT